MKLRIITLLTVAFIAFTSSAGQSQRGYRGFIDWSSSLRSENAVGFNNSTNYYTGFSTSHGYQFNPYLFVGAGLDYEHCSKDGLNIVALYLHGRGDFNVGKFTPFGDIRVGYDTSYKDGGLYFSPSVGYRFSLWRKLGLNIGAGLTLLRYTVDTYEEVVTGGIHWLNRTGSTHCNNLFFSFRLGFDF